MKAWKLLYKSRRLGYGDNRLVEEGAILEVPGEPVLCSSGIHASRKLSDCTLYKASNTVARVEILGDVRKGKDKLCTNYLKVLWIVEAAPAFRKFCKLTLLDYADFYPIPQEVLDFLYKTEIEVPFVLEDFRMQLYRKITKVNDAALSTLTAVLESAGSPVDGVHRIFHRTTHPKEIRQKLEPRLARLMLEQRRKEM